MAKQAQIDQPAKMQVPLLDLKAQYAALKHEIMPEVEQVLDSQQMINGPAVQQLEEDVARYSRTRAAVGVSSGTDALIVALMALNIECGQEVITTPYTFFATAGSLWRQGVRPVFVDIDEASFNLDVTQVEDAITPRTAAIMPVHLFGQMTPMQPLLQLADRHELHVIEDAAQAIGATQDGRAAGELGTAAAFSFFPSKNLGGAGDGGMVVTQDQALADRMRIFRNHGAEQRYFHQQVGGNFRLDTLQAAYLRVKLRHLDDWHEQRRANARLYDELLAPVDEVTTPAITPGNTSIYNQYVIRADRRDALRERLRVALRRPVAVVMAPRPEVAVDRTIRLDGGFVEEGVRAVEAGEEERVAADGAFQKAMIARRREERAGELRTLLLELAHGVGRGAVLVNERDVPSPTYVGGGIRGCRKESIRIAMCRPKRQALDRSAALHDGECALQRGRGVCCGDARVEGR